ncbi:MAG: chitobiase/beta-hexosaminidase C-terminal domain-containing protein [Methanobrevibacter sp.]|nr:chitobiase/beta-hexosaminidase C-terminal domain-containing protein [Methanobrevibacter sp.]
MDINFNPRVVNGTVNFTAAGYVNVTRNVSITVLVMPTTLVSSDVVKYYLNGTQWVARLLDVSGNPLAGKRLYFKVGNGGYNITTDDDGYAVLDINFNPRVVNGTVNFTAAGYVNVTKDVTITVLPMPTSIVSTSFAQHYLNVNDWVARLLDIEGHPLANKRLRFNVGGNEYNRTTNAEGYASLSINLMPQVYDGTVSFSENNYGNSSKSIIIMVWNGTGKLITSISANSFQKMYQENKTLSAALIDGMHRPISNKTLVLLANNQSFSGVTDSSGNAYFDIDLLPGNYSASILFYEDFECGGSVQDLDICIEKTKTKINIDDFEVDNQSFLRFVLVDNFNNVISNVPIEFILFNSSNEVFSNITFITDDDGEIIISKDCILENCSLILNYEGSEIFSEISSIFNLSDKHPPTVWASYGSGFYTASFDVELNSLDDTDDEPIIYYTIDGSLPTENSEIYSVPLHISFRNNLTALRFFAMDKYGHRSEVVNVYYFFGNYVANLNSGKRFDDVQSAIDDNDTMNGDIIEVNKDLSGGCVLHKSVYLRSSGLGDFTWSYPCIEVIRDCCVIDGFNFYLGHTAIYLSGISNCICNNNFYVGDYGIWSSSNNFNNMIINNNFSSNNNLAICIYLLPFINEVNTVLIKDNFFNSSYCGVALEGSINSIIMGNVFSNLAYGIHLFGENSSLIGNSFDSNSVGAVVSGENAYIYDNNFTSNSYGLKLYGDTGSILSNNIVENEYGVFSPGSNNLSVNFNRISSNSAFGLKVNSGHVNATNNWWGQNNVSVGSGGVSDVFYSENLEIVYEPYIIMRSYISYYEIRDMFVENVTCVADLNFNNFEEYVPFYGHLPDGFNVTFRDSKGGPYPRFGVVSSGQAKYTTVTSYFLNNFTVILDNEVQNVSYARYHNSARFYVNTSAVVLENSTDLNVSDNYYTYDVIFNDTVDWVSFIWRYLGDFRSEVSLVVDGEIVESYIVESSFYHNNPLNFSSNVFEGLDFYNDIYYNELSWAKALAYVYISLDNNLTTLDEVIYDYTQGNWRTYSPELQHQLLEEHNTTFESALLGLIQNSYNLTDDEISFIYENHSCLRDDICVSVHYYGDDNEYKNFDVDNQSQLLLGSGMWTFRNGTVMYVNGSYAHLIDNDLNESVDIYTYYHNFENGTIDWLNGYSYGNYSEGGYDGLLTYVFANDKVSSSVLSYWLSESNRTDLNGSLVFSNGFMKAVYGSFLEGLLVIYMDDLVADVSAFELGVCWERVSPMVMSVRDDHFRTVMSGESSFYFGRKVLSEDEDIRRAFYFACSASFSPIEFYVHKTLFPGIVGGGVTVDFGNYLLGDGTLRVDDEGRYVFIFVNSSDVDSYLCFDRDTGLFRDASWFGSGAYCYSNQQTGWACDLAGELLDNYGLVWDYLTGNGGDISVLNGSTQGMLKVCNGMGILSGLFGGACLSDLGVLIDSIGLDDSFASIVPLIGGVVSTMENVAGYVYEEYVSDPKFLSGVAGGLLFEAGMIATCTGVGAPIGLALIGVGTVCTAYSSGLLDFNNNGPYINASDENCLGFGFSMGLNLITGGSSGVASRCAFKEVGGKVSQVSLRNVVTSVDQRGLYSTTLFSAQKRVVMKDSSKPVGKYIIEELVGAENPTKTDYIRKIATSYGENISFDYIFDNVKYHYLTN